MLNWHCNVKVIKSIEAIESWNLSNPVEIRQNYRNFATHQNFRSSFFKKIWQTFNVASRVLNSLCSIAPDHCDSFNIGKYYKWSSLFIYFFAISLVLWSLIILVYNWFIVNLFYYNNHNRHNRQWITQWRQWKSVHCPLFYQWIYPLPILGLNDKGFQMIWSFGIGHLDHLRNDKCQFRIMTKD